MDDQNNNGQSTSSGLFSGGTPNQQNEPAVEQSSAPAPTPEVKTEEDKAKEKELLMQRARLMGLTVSNNIGVETLRKRINDALDGKDEQKAAAEDGDAELGGEGETNALTGEADNAPKKDLRTQIYEEQMKLVRINLTCMNPAKKDLKGEIFTIANEYLGTVSKFVPYGEDVQEDGWHVPYCIYTMLKEREFLNIRTTKDRRTGAPMVESKYVKEFAIELLPPLTQEELNRLALAQKAAGSLN